MAEDKKRMRGGKEAIGFGSVLAITLSWTANKAIGWAVIHGILGWFYVIYYLIFKSDWTWF
ncbi:MAG: hypothetical protein H6510_02445 [Acidobacteria bacterium]|nr:hypothetical protein [Acidobacteriota bacterium]MCB9396654.1 hypothetical protein [Acidobacteriota bacterium]